MVGAVADVLPGRHPWGIAFLAYVLLGMVRDALYRMPYATRLSELAAEVRGLAGGVRGLAAEVRELASMQKRTEATLQAFINSMKRGGNGHSKKPVDLS